MAVETLTPLTSWPFQVPSLTPFDIQRAIGNPEWQAFRLSLKSVPTGIKLARLKLYLETSPASEYDLRLIRVANYINALKRGGQLNMDMQVQR